MAKKKKSSCLGLFFKGTVLSGLVLAILAVLGIMANIQFMGADPVIWTDFSDLGNRPWMVMYGVAGLALCMGAVLGVAGAAISALFGNSKKEGTASSSKVRSKPQSNRKTTI